MDLVEHQHGAGLVSLGGRKARRLPLLLDPRRTAQRGFVRAAEARREVGRIDDLLHQRGLADLPRAGDHVHKPPPLGKARSQGCGLGSDYSTR